LREHEERMMAIIFEHDVNDPKVAAANEAYNNAKFLGADDEGAARVFVNTYILIGEHTT
jgi:hypothetical protein